MSTKISATIIADSKNEFGQRLITYVLVFPRIILAELNTHRMFSRNSASSRAIPFKKMLEKVQNDPFIPIAWQIDHSGMQGTKYLTAPIDLAMANDLWLEGRDYAVRSAKNLSVGVSLTKQLCNRLLEPFMWHTAIVTATEYENFFALRCPQYAVELQGGLQMLRSRKDVLTTVDLPVDFEEEVWLKLNKGQGEIHIMALAEAMWDSMHGSKPKLLKAGEWHIPFGDQIDRDRLKHLLKDQSVAGELGESIIGAGSRALIKIAVARCARVSYMNFDGSDDYEKDIALYDRLAASGHMSPFEHVAQAMTDRQYINYCITRPVEGPSIRETEQGWCGNFRGFIQMRKMIPNENRTV